MSNFFEKFASSVFFDWYQGTFSSNSLVSISADRFISKVLSAFPLSSAEVARPRVNQYQRAVDIKRGDMQIVHVCWEGMAPIHFIATGSISQDFADFMQSNYSGEYGISRADVRADMVDPAAWEYMHGIAYRFAQRSRNTKGTRPIETNCMGDWDTGNGGRTYYLGSCKSAVQVRIYEKGKKEGGNQDWVRYEAQVRPPKSNDKVLAGLWRPVDFWNSKPWLMKLSAEIFFNQSLPKVESFKSVWGVSGDLERTTRALCRQYGNTLGSLYEQFGNWELVGDYLGKYLSVLKENKGQSCGFGSSPYPNLPIIDKETGEVVYEAA
jgi:hypothetical protein